MQEKLVLLGSGGHAQVVLDAALAMGTFEILGFVDFTKNCDPHTLPFPYLGDYDRIPALQEAGACFVIAIGSNRIREEVATEYPDLCYATVIHPRAIVSPTATVDPGTVIFPSAVVNARTAIGAHCIINTGAIVEHDNRIGDYVHLAPGAVTGGTVSLGSHCLLGIHSTVIPNLTLSDHIVIGAGAVVTENLTQSGTYVGIPAKNLSRFLKGL